MDCIADVVDRSRNLKACSSKVTVTKGVRVAEVFRGLVGLK